jgi:hypothetical protein
MQLESTQTHTRRQIERFQILCGGITRKKNIKKYTVEKSEQEILRGKPEKQY